MKNTHNRITILSIVFLFLSSSFISGLSAQSSPSLAVPMPKAELDELSIAVGHISNECSENIQCPTVDVSNAKKLAEAMEQVVITFELFKGWITEGRRTTGWNDPEWVKAQKLVDDAYEKLTKTQKTFYTALSQYDIPRSYQGEKGGNWRNPYAAIRNLNDRLVKQIQTLIPLQLAFMLRPAPFPTMKLNKKTFNPGETITIEFTARQCYGNTAWIGIVPSAIQHKNEPQSNRNKIARKFMERQTSGSFTFTAPQKTGSYDFRMFDSESNGNEVQSVSFTVKESYTAADLTGNWEAAGYGCDPPIPLQKIKIQLKGTKLIATKITGDDCVPAGNVTWEGTLNGNVITAQGKVSSGAKTPMRWIPVTITVIDKNTLQGFTNVTYRRK